MDEAHVKAEAADPQMGAQLEEAVRTLLDEIGEDGSRQGLIGTPSRVRRMYAELTDGYRADPDALINNACFDVEYDEMVVVRNIEFFSLCEHHLLPFYGHAHVGYLPRGKVIGLSKIPSIVDMYAHRLQVQERLTQQVAHLLMDRLDPKGVACVVEATHLCTVMRGVKKQEASMVTSSMLGTFRRDPKTRGEFLTLIGRPAGPLA
ncbi:MAG TPA: GTP cyclohydrolase I FolE [Candidatus Limnocylindria bacterium]|nr:GTP cyclohydrolase I FolE [Candidatus Limnocylindria bacterium]